MAPTMQGVSFAPVLADPAAEVRKYGFSEHNWHDYEAHGRSIRSEGFLYLRNNRPLLAWQGPADSVASPSFQQLRAVRDAGKLTAAQADVFLAPRPVEELYRTDGDPHQLHNLANDPDYASVKTQLSKLLDEWSEATHDSVPADLSKDTFDRETGKSLLKLTERLRAPRGTPAGWDRDAARTNAPGPR
ncbi:MAG: hypothetical protein B7Z55_01110 [Planctomycetales bacterium 12-60-4]|nr:MAG: hypothetical protein B7Z55_01110 [Planctomycetales bacterium 12-60-4]